MVFSYVFYKLSNGVFFFQETKKLLNKVKVMFYVMVYNLKIMVFSYVFYKLSNGSFFQETKKLLITVKVTF